MNNAILIQQGCPGPHREMLELTRRHHAAYAARHRMDYWPITEPQQEERPPNWDRLLLLLRAFESARYRWMFWLDADTVIARPEVDLRQALGNGKEIGMVTHPIPPHLNDGALYLRRGPEVRRLLERAWNSWPVNHPWQEQTAINWLLASEWREELQILPAAWNSTWGVNMAANAVVKAWHGVQPAERRLQLMTQALEDARRAPAPAAARRSIGKNAARQRR